MCKNPWKNPSCKNTDIHLYILRKDEMLPVCRECWLEIADSDKEW